MDKLELARRCADRMLANDSAIEALGIEIDIPEAGRAVAKMTVRQDMVNGLDVLHGGYVFTLADTAFAFACNAYNQQSIAASAQIDFLRPGRLGDTMTATAREDHRGRRSAYYSVEVRNPDNELVALFRGRSVSSGEPHLK